MVRRYLTKAEVVSALRRGKHVESFLGGFDADGLGAIRWSDFYGDGTNVYGRGPWGRGMLCN